MKIRINYVSNSSSSSFIIWGDNAFDYINCIEDGYAINIDDAFYYIWNKRITKSYYRSTECTFISDDEWKEKFDNGYDVIYTLPISIQAEAYYSNNIDDYKKVFYNWFYENYKNEQFYFIDFSDHPDETKYHENDMYDVMCDYSGKGFSFFNH